MPGLGAAPDESGFKPPSGGAVRSPAIYRRVGWSRADYERQWCEAAERLAAGAPSTAFFTTAFKFWWPMWRDGAAVLAHEEFLHPDRLAVLGPAPDLSRAPYQLVGEYRAVTEDGERLSEWRLTFADIEAFLARRQGLR